MAGGLLWGCLCAASWLLVSGQVLQLQVDENANVNIPCKAYQRGARRMEWKFKRGDNMMLFYHGGEFAGSYKDRALFYPNEISLRSVTRRDTGLYTCEVLGDNGLASSMVNLVVKVPPSKPLAEVPSTVIIGNEVVINCLETDGSPRPTFSWYKNNMLMPVDPKTSSLFKNSSYSLDPNTGVLTFLPLTPYDVGDYYCEASNGVRTPQKSDVRHLEPRLSVSGQAPQLQVDENANVNIPCKAHQRGARRMEWKFKRGDNTMLLYHDGEFTGSYKDRAIFYPNEIYLRSVTRQDTGLYTCEVLGDNGLASSMVNLVVKGTAPSAPAEPPASVKELDGSSRTALGRTARPATASGPPRSRA